MINKKEAVGLKMPSRLTTEFPEREISPELRAYLNPSYTPEGMAIMEEAAAWAKSFDDFSICKIEVTEEMLNRPQPTTKDWGIKPINKK